MGDAPNAKNTRPVEWALQHAWDEFCADTGCFPECFDWQGGKLHADFTKGGFARAVSEWLRVYTHEVEQMSEAAAAGEAVVSREGHSPP